MVISKHRLEYQKKLRLLREERDRRLRATTTNSVTNKKSKNGFLSEGVIKYTDFDQVEEIFYDNFALQQWIDDLVDEWGLEPEFDEIWPALKKEERKFAGFVGEMGMPMLRRTVQDILDAKKVETGEWPWPPNSEPIFENYVWDLHLSPEEEDRVEKIMKYLGVKAGDAAAVANALENASAAEIAGLDDTLEKLEILSGKLQRTMIKLYNKTRKTV
jgi:hypothetical protein